MVASRPSRSIQFTGSFPTYPYKFNPPASPIGSGDSQTWRPDAVCVGEGSISHCGCRDSGAVCQVLSPGCSKKIPDAVFSGERAAFPDAVPARHSKNAVTQVRAWSARSRARWFTLFSLAAGAANGKDGLPLVYGWPPVSPRPGSSGWAGSPGSLRGLPAGWQRAWTSRSCWMLTSV